MDFQFELWDISVEIDNLNKNFFSNSFILINKVSNKVMRIRDLFYL